MIKKLCATLFLLLLLLPTAALATDDDNPSSEISPNHSIVTTGANNITVDPYESFDVTIDLRTSRDQSPSVKPSGKLYIWATDENDNVSTGLDVVQLSLGSGVYCHQTTRTGVLIMDAAALITPQSFNLTLDKAGTYELHTLYMYTGTINPNNITDYWPFELTGGNTNERIVVVNTTPARDVGMMVVSTKIRGISINNFLVTDPRDKTLTDTSIPVDKSTTAQTDIQLALLRSNGLSVGAGVPVYVSSSASSTLYISNVMVQTNANGIAHVYVSGSVKSGDMLYLRTSLTDSPVAVPLSSYEYTPHTVRFKIGEKSMNVDGVTIETDTAAVVKNSRTYVPYRVIGELLGARIAYDNKVQTITTSFGNSTLTMTVGYNRYAIDGKVHTMDAIPYINESGRTMVPIRFIAEVLGFEVTPVYNSQKLTESVIFTKK